MPLIYSEVLVDPDFVRVDQLTTFAMLKWLCSLSQKNKHLGADREKYPRSKGSSL